jgi:tetratricopeptide (TPR) repeat protein
MISFLFISANAFAQENITSDTLKEQGMIFYKEGKYLEALNCFERLDKNSLNSELLLLTANCYDSLSNYKKASEFLIKSIEHNPENSFPYYNLGIIQFKNNNVNGAIENFKKAIKYNSNFTAAYYNLGVCYYLLNDYKKAKENFIISNNLDPDNRNICYNLVLTFNALKDKAMAEKYLDIYSKMTDEYPVDNINKTIPPENNMKLKEKSSFLQNMNFIK